MTIMKKAILALIALTVLLILAAPGVSAAAAEPQAQKAVLVTGASTGIGRKIAEGADPRDPKVKEQLKILYDSQRAWVKKHYGLDYVEEPLDDLRKEMAKWLEDK